MLPDQPFYRFGYYLERRQFYKPTVYQYCSTQMTANVVGVVVKTVMFGRMEHIGHGHQITIDAFNFGKKCGKKRRNAPILWTQTKEIFAKCVLIAQVFGRHFLLLLAFLSNEKKSFFLLCYLLKRFDEALNKPRIAFLTLK